MYYCTSGYLPERYDQYSPGRTLMGHTIQTAIEEGVHVYDFLRGDHAYKRRFGAEPVPQIALSGYAGMAVRAGLGTWDSGAAAARKLYRTARRQWLRRLRSSILAGPDPAPDPARTTVT